MSDGVSLAAPTQGAEVQSGDGGGNAPISTPDPNAAPVETGGGQWNATISDDYQGFVKEKGWTGADDALKAYRDLEGRALTVPETDDAEAWDSVWQKLGRPEEANGYDLKAEGVPEETLSGIKQMAFNMGATPKQAQLLQEQLLSLHGQQQQQAQEHLANRLSEAKVALEKDWGQEGSDSFTSNLEMARRATEHLGGEQLMGELRALGAITKDNQITSPVLATALSKIGKELFTEGEFQAGHKGGQNPFVDDRTNITEQMTLIKENPAHAKQLIVAAGKNPTDYNLT